MASEQIATTDRAVYSSLLLLGVGMLFPRNAFITAADYFEAKYPGHHADRLFSVCYLPTQLVTLLVVVFWHEKLAQFSRLRISVGYAGFAAIMVLVAAVEGLFEHAFGVVLFLVFITGLLDGIAQGALYGQYALLPPIYTQAIVSGTAISGTAVSFLRIITKAATDSLTGLAVGAYLYFALASMVCILCTVVFAVLLPRQPVVQAMEVEQSSHSPLTHLEGSANLANDSQAEEQILQEPDCEAVQDSHLLTGQQPSAAQLWKVMQKTWEQTASLVTIYTITLAIFPGFLVEDVNSAFLGSWYPIVLISWYNLADLCGKSLPPQLFFMTDSGRRLLAGSLVRCLFIPAFSLAARLGGGTLLMILLTMALGISNGYLTSIAMMRTPEKVSSPGEKNLAGNLAVLALVGGLAIGSACSFLWLL